MTPGVRTPTVDRVSSTDDPFAPPPTGPSRPAPPGGTGQSPVWGAPTDEPRTGPPPGPSGWASAPTPPAAGSSVGTAALVLGLLATITGITVLGGLLFGVPAVLAGLRARRSGRSDHRRTGRAVAGIVLGILGLTIACGVWTYVRDDVARFQDCRKASVSVAQDEQCQRDLERSLKGDR